MLTAVLPEDADVDGGDDDDDDVVVVTSKMTVQGARSALHTAATGVTSAVRSWSPTIRTSPARRCKTVSSWPRLPRWRKAYCSDVAVRASTSCAAIGLNVALPRMPANHRRRPRTAAASRHPWEGTVLQLGKYVGGEGASSPARCRSMLYSKSSITT